MSPRRIKEKVLVERAAWVRKMLEGLRSLPFQDPDGFLADPRNVAAAESYLRRALEALLDLGRHVLAGTFGQASVEYKEIAIRLAEHGVLGPEEGALLRDMAGYRNRLVHFYAEIGPEELLQILQGRLNDIELVLERILGWVRDHPESVDRG